MTTPPRLGLQLIAEVPDHQRYRILSGMRWTVWLAALALPFSYANTALLARVSPEAIGIYGLLTVYIGVVTAFLYLGGNSVVIRFIPELNSADRLSFLASYLTVILIALLPWLGLASIWPDKLHYLFGERGDGYFYLLILWLSPVCIVFSLIVSTLKGMLEIRWAQALMRLLTFGSFLLYASLYLGARSFLKAHYSGVIWGVYLGLVTLGVGLGFDRLMRLTPWSRSAARLRFFLPQGFWRYALATQQVGLVAFLSERTDYVLMLNFGGLQALGKYVAVASLSMLIPAVNTFFLDTLLPSLTNLVAARNYKGASDVFAMHMRILLVVNTGMTTGVMLMAGPLTMLLGANYISLRTPVVLMTLLVGLGAPGSVGTALLASVGKQQREVWIRLAAIGIFVTLFLALWPRWQLIGAVLAYGLTLFTLNALLLLVARFSTPIPFSIAADYAKFGLVALLTAAIALRSLPTAYSLFIWPLAVLLFLLAARYRLAECIALIRCFVPARQAASLNATLLSGRILETEPEA